MLKQYYQKITKSKYTFNVLDFDKIRKLPHNVFVLMTERGQHGKTYNMKEHILKRWLKNKEKAVWIVNTEDQLKTAKNRFLTQHRNNEWENYIITMEGVKDLEGEIIIYFAAINTYHKQKGGRDDAITTLVYEEFNEGMRTIFTKQKAAFDSLVHTFSSPHKSKDTSKIFLLANTKTLAVPILDGLGIKELQGEETELKKGSLKIWVYTPAKNEADLANLKQRWKYDLSVALGAAESSFLNLNVNDNYKNVDESRRDISFKLLYIMVIQFSFYSVYKSEHHGEIYIEKVEEIPEDCNDVGWLKEVDNEVGRRKFKYFADYLNHWLGNEVVFFDELITKITLIASIGARREII